MDTVVTATDAMDPTDATDAAGGAMTGVTTTSAAAVALAARSGRMAGMMRNWMAIGMAPGTTTHGTHPGQRMTSCRSHPHDARAEVTVGDATSRERAKSAT
jgi:hypothetical protein